MEEQVAVKKAYVPSVAPWKRKQEWGGDSFPDSGQEFHSPEHPWVQCGENQNNIEAGFSYYSPDTVFSQPWNVLLIALPEDRQDELLLRVRGSDNWRRPVFVRERSPLSDALSDGLLPSSLQAWLVDFQARSKVRRIASIDGRSRLVNYLVPRPNARVRPVWDPSAKSLYIYPLLEALGAEYEDLKAESLAMEGLLVRDELVDRIRLCAHCESGALNYVDVCPSCKSIEINEVRSLHCFTCGTVNDEDKFKRVGKLECPNCSTTLRHIGVDYDRPLETMDCASCQTMFSEAEIVAKCHRCLRRNNPSSLFVRNIQTYRLGNVSGLFKSSSENTRDSIDFGGCDQLDRFSWALNWLSSRRESSRLKHVILCAHFTNYDAVLDSEGGRHVESLVDEFVARIVATVQSQDIVARVGRDTIFVVFPDTDKKLIRSIKTALDPLVGASLLSVQFEWSDLPIKAGSLIAEKIDEAGIDLPVQ